MVLDENDIKNVTFRTIMKAVEDADLPAILAMPESQLKKGLRGFAKAKILFSLIPKLESVLPLTAEELVMESSEAWGKVFKLVRKSKNAEIGVSEDEGDKKLMEEAQRSIDSSNCWYYPAGCVIAEEGKVLVSAVSTSWDSDNFEDIQLSMDDIELNPGERMNFGEAMHAEQLAVAKAAREGIKLEGTTIYVSKFPCLNCAMSIIGAGIKRVVFEEDSYGIADAYILVENGVELVKVVHSS